MKIEPVDADELRSDMSEIINNMSDDVVRWRFEIEVDGCHIGMVSSNYVDNNFENTPWEAIDQRKNALENKSIRSLGIEICEMEYWGKGIGTKVLTALMEYYRGFGEKHFLLETWSGNFRMLGCARKLGFYEIKRTRGGYIVDGKKYDALVLEKKFQ